MEQVHTVIIKAFLGFEAGKKRLKVRDEKGAISIEAAILAAVLVTAAIAIAAKLGALKDKAVEKIPSDI